MRDRDRLRSIDHLGAIEIEIIDRRKKNAIEIEIDRSFDRRSLNSIARKKW
jgi:hypothetical protein